MWTLQQFDDTNAVYFFVPSWREDVVRMNQKNRGLAPLFHNVMYSEISEFIFFVFCTTSGIIMTSIS
ncbi:hypothetical protein RND71_027876 [Anisodus tanguticus]|uniref:Uncharacterized protein n=1 Tax=Anisodus tanguticus TaxID=243964 RepID=A0AAE1V119_9SOLA|nr:hypothetical protein RND71_027876 [Anisodus tanguticus]